MLDKVLWMVTDREWEIYKRLRGIEVPVETLEEVAKHFAITPQRVEQINKKCSHKLNHPRRIRLIKTLPEEQQRYFI